MTGDTVEYDESKAAELILYIAEQTEEDKTAGSVKLNTILYFSELLHLRRTGVPITGADYQKLDHGPALRRMLPIIERLRAEGAATTVDRDYFGSTQRRLVALRPPDLDRFSADEIAAVDRIIVQFWGKNATQTSGISHEDAGWRAVESGESIPLSLAFIDVEGEVTDRIREKARELAQRL
ncbi:MAG: Panacea domain-containing protein [Acidimicrobiia bacterium]